MSQTDSPKHRGDVLTSAWRNSNPQIGIPQADWSHCDIRNKECPRFRAIYRNLEYLAAPGCDLTESLFAHCNLNHTDFQRALAPGASWHSSFLEQARLNAIRAPKADFRQAHLRSASFQRSILNHSLFSFANIQHANFQQADLRYSDLRAANLQFAKIDGATLTGAIINPQTQDSSNWTKKTIQQWLDAGAVWTEKLVTPTRFSSGIDLSARHRTSLNVGDALTIVCQPNTIAIAGGPPNLFISTPVIDPYKIIERILQIASHSDPPEESLRAKWCPLNEWLRKGGTMTPWNNSETGFIMGTPTTF